MNNQLEKFLKEFKNITLDLIKALEDDNLDAMEELLDKRQSIIIHLENIEYTTEEFKEIVNQIDILTLQKKLLDLMNEKKVKLRTEMDKLSETKAANKSYKSKFAVDSVYFNKKI